jgi:hypothetical protein
VSRWPPYGRPETSRLLKVDHYMLQVCTEMRSGQYASPRQDANTGKGYQEFIGAVCYQRSGCPELGVCTWLFEPL